MELDDGGWYDRNQSSGPPQPAWRGYHHRTALCPDVNSSFEKAKLKGEDAVLASSLWATELLEARILALRILPRDSLTEEQIDAWVGDLNFPPLADEFAQAVYHTPFARKKMEAWIESDSDYVRRTGYSLLYGFAADRSSDIGNDVWLGYLDRIGREIHQSPNWSREMMNILPIAIGLRESALFQPALDTVTAYGKIEVFHGDKTNCKVQDAIAALNDPRTKIKAY